jgi:hypothetical protein
MVPFGLKNIEDNFREDMMKYFTSLILVLSFFVTNAFALSVDVDTLRSPDHSKVFTLPNATTTLVGKDTSDDLSNKTLDKLVSTTEQINAAPTGANALVSSPTSIVVSLTNASLTSIDGVVAPTNNQIFILKNHTGGNVTVNNLSGATAAAQIKTGTGANLVVADQASLILAYSTSDAKWQVVGGSGAGGGGGASLSVWVTAHAYLTGDIAIESNKLYKALADHTSGTFATDLSGGKWVELSAGVTDHTLLSNIGTNTHAQIDTHIASTSNPHSVTKTQVGLGNVTNVDTSTTANITDSTNKRFVTDANATDIATISSKQDKSTLTTKGDVYVATAAGVTTRQAVGSDGTQPIADSGTTTGIRYGYDYDRNYITNDGAETDNSGWSTFTNTITAGVPTTLTGGAAPASTFLRTTSSNLNGSGSFTFSKASGNKQGEGFSTSFSIDNADVNKVLRIDFNYQVASGTYSDDVMSCWVYDTTNSALIQPAPYLIKNTGGKEPMAMEFQSTSSTTYRFGCVVVSSAHTSAFDLKFDKFKISKFAKAYGSPVTDWVDFTPTLTAGTLNTTAYVAPNGKWRRIGDSMEIVVGFKNGSGGAMTGSGYVGFVLPTGYHYDSSKQTNILGGHRVDGYGAKDSFASKVFVNGDNIYLWKEGVDYYSVSDIGASATFSIRAIVPIVGWSSSTIMSSDADTRVTALSIGALPATAVTAANSASSAAILKFTTIRKDTHGCYSASTGVCTIKVPGTYKIYLKTFAPAPASGLWSVQLFKSGSGEAISTYPVTAATAGFYTLSAQIDAVAGDTIDARALVQSGSATITFGQNSSAEDIFTIERISGPAQISSSDSVSVRYSGTTGQSLTTSATNVPFQTKNWDSHGNSYASGIFTAPMSGTYSIASRIAFTLNGSQGHGVYMSVWVNGSLYTYLDSPVIQTASVSYGTSLGGSTTVKLLAGQTVEIKIERSSGQTANNISTATNENFIAIDRTGNY